jgi:hypothetical protein
MRLRPHSRPRMLARRCVGAPTSLASPPPKISPKSAMGSRGAHPTRARAKSRSRLRCRVLHSGTKEGAESEPLRSLFLRFERSLRRRHALGRPERRPAVSGDRVKGAPRPFQGVMEHLIGRTMRALTTPRRPLPGARCVLRDGGPLDCSPSSSIYRRRATSQPCARFGCQYRVRRRGHRDVKRIP